MHGVVKHLALIRARMGVVVLTSYHNSRAGYVRVVHRSLAATSPGLCLQGCVAQGAPGKGVRRRAARKVRSGWSVRRQRRSAPCAWHAAVVLPRISAQPRAEMMGGKLLGSAAQPGAGCGTRSPATGAGCVGAICEGAICVADAISAAPPWCSVVVGRGHGCGQRTRERRWRRGCHVSSVIAFGYSFEEDTNSGRSLGCSDLLPHFFYFLDSYFTPLVSVHRIGFDPKSECLREISQPETLVL